MMILEGMDALSDTRKTGILGEQLASDSLARRGYEIVERGWRCPLGEVDIVARDGACWVFVEVKTRRGRGAGLPEEALTPRKAERLTELAQTYLSAHALGEVDWRIDLVAIELDVCGGVKRLDVVPCVAAG
jgi:putative endonuclease